MFKGNENNLPFRWNREEFLEFFLAEGVHERHKIKALNETDQTEQMNLVVRRIIESINGKVDMIDMRSFDKSRGDLKKVKHYSQVSQAIVELRNLTGGQEPSVLKLVELESNLLKYKTDFTKGYNSNKKLVKWLYSTACLDLYYGTMLAIAHVADIVQTDTSITIQPNLKSQISNSYLFNNIDRMNELFRSGKAREIFASEHEVMNEDFGSSMLLAAGAIAGVAVLVYLIREAVLYFFKLRKGMTREFKIVNEYLELNQAITSDRKVAANQRKLAKDVQKLSDMIAIESDTAEVNTIPEVRREINTEYKELGLKPPSSSGSSASSSLI